MAEQSLRSVLKVSRPGWTQRDLAAAEAKLANLSIRTSSELALALQTGLNERLRLAELRPFTSSTLQALRSHLGIEDESPDEAVRDAPPPLHQPRVSRDVVPDTAAPHTVPGDSNLTKLEHELRHQSLGLLDPRQLVAAHRTKPHIYGVGKQGRVSVVTPTVESRQSFHQTLYSCFIAQSWQDKELVVVETYENQFSEFLYDTAKADPRLVYIKFQRPPGADWSIGLKRNIGAHLASGEYIAHFDDDDIYAPTYLASMLPGLRDSNSAQGVTLKNWFLFDQETGSFGFCDPERWGSMQGMGLHHDASAERLEKKVKAWVYGYGFSYVYRRSAVLATPFQNKDLGEDYGFFEQLREEHGNECILLQSDFSGICLHMQHGGNTSSTVALWEVTREEISDLDFADLVIFDVYMWRCPRKDDRQSEHIEDWTGRGGQLVMSAKRRLRDLTLHTPFGDVVLRCPRGAKLREVLAEAEYHLGALSPNTRALRAPGDDQPVSADERLGVHAKELWLLLDDAVTSGVRESSSVRVACPVASLGEGSVSRIFHVSLPLEARVADLRQVLMPGLPQDAQIFASMPGKRLALADSARVPAEVALSKFEGTVTIGMVVTREQAAEVQEWLREAMLRPEVQEKLDEFEQKSQGKDAKYRMFLQHFLNYEIYPPLVKRMGLPEDGTGPYILFQAIGAYLEGDLSMNERWLVLEFLMRNKPMLAQAYYTVNMMRTQRGMPEWKWPEHEWPKREGECPEHETWS